MPLNPRAADRPYFRPEFIPMAHRGGSLLPANVGRENTLAAFRAAVDLGYRYLETDVHATRDGRLVAFHDDRLDRVTDVTGAIAELSWGEVRRARVGAGDDRIPTFDELLEELPDARFNVDIKAAGAVAPLWSAIKRHGAYDRVCVASFSDVRLNAFRALARGRVATSCGPVAVGAFHFAPWLMRWMYEPGLALQIPVSTRFAGRDVRLVTPELVRTAHAAGKVVQVWDVDDAAEMHDLLDLGVDGLITDRPDVLRAVLRDRGMWEAD